MLPNPIYPIGIDMVGTPRTANQQVKVGMIAQKYVAVGETVESIAEHYGISLADVYAALARLHKNREWFEQREQEIAPLVEAAPRYLAELKANIDKRLKNLPQAE
jgi:uncharacterized protein (DUF433 family)